MRPVLLSLSATAAAIGAVAAVASSAANGAAAPTSARSAAAGSSYSPPIADTTITAPKSQLAAATPPTTPYEETISTGETVSIRLSKVAFGNTGNATAAQQWANFFGSLLHGPELSSLEVYLLTPTEVESICGRDAVACYGGDQLYTPADDPDPDLTAESVAAHEYGHHVAYHRQNDPWAAVDWGPKRWASVMQVCANTRAGRFFPGAEDQNNYVLNPGEGWAEAYRVLNERRLGIPEAPWQVVSDVFSPGAAALAAAQADVTTPWTSPTTTTLKGSVRKGAAKRTFSVTTPLDGQLRVSLTAARGERVTLNVLAGSSTRLLHKVGRIITGSATICGQRTIRVQVTRVSGSGAFRASVTRP